MTAQIAEYLRYQGEGVRMCTEPLEWTIEQYAELLAPDLYRLESMETAPRIFSNVLRNWGPLPQALITEQFIPPASSRKQPDKPLRDLSPRSKTKPPRGFLSRLFGSD